MGGGSNGERKDKYWLCSHAESRFRYMCDLKAKQGYLGEEKNKKANGVESVS